MGSSTRAERRRAAREHRPDLVVAVTSELLPEHSNVDDALRGAIFALAFLVGPEKAATARFEWEWDRAGAAERRLAELVRANPPARLRKHYRRLRDDLRRVPDSYLGFARATLTP